MLVKELVGSTSELPSTSITPKMKVGNITAYVLDDADQFLVVGKCNIPIMSGFIRDDNNGNDI